VNSTEAQIVEPDRWQNIERIYHAAMEREESQRVLYLEQACAADQALRAEVESLLKYAQRPARYFDKPALEVVAHALAEDLSDKTDKLLGARIGQYRIVGKLGAGGMGDIYRAVRADDQYEKQVAIKLVRQGLDTEFIYARFRRERQILAGFEHENIARLVDGGTTEDGHPYFVMELVEGKPIDEYCDELKLTTPARVQLFQQVCSAVQYAHQRLVVHRDIKPGNILVTADGVPKLLDFGIATILSPETYAPQADPTVTAMRMMTPQFAGPEQLRGEVITTATDVYSLGVVLYKLLTGHMPYRVDLNSPYDLAHAICEIEPEKPSTAVGHSQKLAENREVTPALVSSSRNTSLEKLRRALSGDLDQILLKALRKEPRMRYASAQDFAEDLRSYSLGLPVSARRGTLSYRGFKFIKRHKIALAAAAVFAVVVIAGVVAIVREERVARTQQARAEQRFNDVRRLANALLFDIHDSIRDLPGATGARKLLVDRALQYLDSLSQDASGTPDLERELAAAYERVGDVQGNPYYANLGDTAGALESYHKALRIRLALGDDRNASPEVQSDLAGIYVKLGIALKATNDFPGALANLRRAYPITEKLANQRKDPLQQETHAGTCFAIAMCLSDTGDLAGALDYFRRSAAIRENIHGGSPEFQKSVQTHLAGVYGYMSGVVHKQGDTDGALVLETKARDIVAALVRADPQNGTLRQFLAEGEYWIGYYFAEKKLPAQALPHYRIAQAQYQSLSNADARNVLAMRYLGKCYMSIGKTLAAEGKTGEGIQNGRKAVHILETLAATDHADRNYKPSDLAYARSALAEDYSREAERQGVPKSTRIASWREARSWYEQSLNTWLQLKQKAPLAQSDEDQLDKITGEMARCDAAIAGLSAANR
jgi:eukaryotic-like serine/threonine-protein kinase